MAREDLNSMMAKLSKAVEDLKPKSTTAPAEEPTAVIEEPAAVADMVTAEEPATEPAPEAQTVQSTENSDSSADWGTDWRQELARQARENVKQARENAKQLHTTSGAGEDETAPIEKMSDARADMLAMKNSTLAPEAPAEAAAEKPAVEDTTDSGEFNEQAWIKKAQEKFANYTYMSEALLGAVIDEEPLPEEITVAELDAVLAAKAEVLNQSQEAQERILLNFRKLEEVVAEISDDSGKLEELNKEDAVEVKILETHKIDNSEQKGLFGWLAKRRAKKQARKAEKKAKWTELVNRGKAAGKKDYEDSLLGKVEARLDEDQKKTADRLKKRGTFLKRDAALLFGGIATTLAAPIALIAGPIASVLGLGSASINTAAGARAGLDALGTSLMKKAIEGSLGAGGVVRSVTSEVVASGAKAALGTPEVKRMLAEQGYTQSEEIVQLRAQMDQMMQMMQAMMAAQNKE